MIFSAYMISYFYPHIGTYHYSIFVLNYVFIGQSLIMFMDSDFISVGLATHDSLFKDKNFLANESLKPYNVGSTRLILFFSLKCS